MKDESAPGRVTSRESILTSHYSTTAKNEVTLDVEFDAHILS